MTVFFLETYQKSKFVTYFDNSKNINKENFFVDKIVVSLSIKNALSFEEVLTCFTFLQLITKEKPHFNKRIIPRRNRIKTNPIGVSIKLRKKKKEYFLKRLIWEILPKIKGISFSIFLKKKDKRQKYHTLNLKLKNTKVFSELNKFYYYYVYNNPITLSFVFGKKQNEKIFFIARLLKLPCFLS